VQAYQGFSSRKPQEMDPGFRRDDVGQESFGARPAEPAMAARRSGKGTGGKEAIHLFVSKAK
jgi:hypothetical protein